MAVKTKRLLIVRYNHRDDNLGDQFIFHQLAEALAVHGRVWQVGTVWPSGLHMMAALIWLLIYRSLHRPCMYFGSLGALMIGPNGHGVGYNTGAVGYLKKSAHMIGYGVCRYLRVPLVRLGISVMPSTDASWCRYYTYVGVRDQCSMDYVGKQGARVHYFPDLAFLAQPELEGAGAVRDSIALSFRRSIPEWGDQQYGDGLLQSLRQLSAAANWGMQDKELFFQVEQDYTFVSELSGILGLPVHRARLTMENARPYYRKQQIVVSNRLHCLLLAALWGAVPVALTSRRHTKLISLFQTIGLDELVLATDTGDDIAARFAAIHANIGEHSQRVAGVVMAQHRLAHETLRMLVTDIGQVQ